MGNRFTIEHRLDKDRLHLMPKGDLDGSTAWQIINLIRDMDDGRQQIVIHTSGLKKIHPFGCRVLRWHMRWAVVNLKRVVFDGHCGEALAPSGCRVARRRTSMAGTGSGDGDPCPC